MTREPCFVGFHKWTFEHSVAAKRDHLSFMRHPLGMNEDRDNECSCQGFSEVTRYHSDVAAARTKIDLSKMPNLPGPNAFVSEI